MSVQPFASTFPQETRFPTLWARPRRSPPLRLPLAKVLAPLGLSLMQPAARAASCLIRQLAPGEHLCDAGTLRYESFIIRRGLALRRDADGALRGALGVAGPREAVALYSPRMTCHAETIVALTALDAAVIDTRVLWWCEDGDTLLGRVVAGPQSAACIRHWVRHSRITNLDYGKRVRVGLDALAQMLEHDRSRLSHLALHCDDLARWLAMPRQALAAELAALEREGALRIDDGVVHAIDADRVWGLNRLGANTTPGALGLQVSAPAVHSYAPAHGIS